MSKVQVKGIVNTVDVEGPTSRKGRAVWFVNGRDAPFKMLTIVFQNDAVTDVFVGGPDSR